MAEKKTTKVAATKAAAEKKPCAKKACATKKAAAEKAPAAKKAAAKKAEAPVEAPVAAVITAENVGFKAGDVYQTLAAAEKALTVKEIAKAANISETEVLLGAGWLLKEGKIQAENEALSLL